MNQTESQSTQPAVPVACAGGYLKYLLRSGGQEQPAFGELKIEYASDADELVALNLIGECEVTMTITIICRTVMGNRWYAATDVCAFAATALRDALAERAPEEITIDAKACKVSCQIKGRTSTHTRMMSMYHLGNHLLGIYTTSFELVRRTHQGTESGDPERIPLPEEEEGIHEDHCDEGENHDRGVFSW